MIESDTVCVISNISCTFNGAMWNAFIKFQRGSTCFDTIRLSNQLLHSTKLQRERPKKNKNKFN